MKRSRTGLVFVAIYVVLVALAVGFVFYENHSAPPGTSELSSLPALILTLPWSLILFGIMAKLISGTPKILTIAVLAFSTLLNALIAYWIGKFLAYTCTVFSELMNPKK